MFDNQFLGIFFPTNDNVMNIFDSKEHKNMPLDDSLGLVDRDYERYCQNVREGRIPPRRPASSSRNDVSSLLNKAASGEKLDPQQLEAIISELQKQKEQNTTSRMPEGQLNDIM